MKIINGHDLDYYTIDGLEAMQEQLLDLLSIVDETCRNNGLSYWLDGGTLIGALRHGKPIPWDDDMDICVPKADFDKLIPLLHERVKNDNKHLLFFYPQDGDRLWAEYFGSLKVLVMAAPGWLPVRLDIAPMKTFPNTPEDIKKERKMSQLLTYCSTGYKVDQSQQTLSSQEKEKFRKYYYNEYPKELEARTSGLNPSDLCVNNFTRENTIHHHQYTDIFPLQDASFDDLKVMIPNDPDRYLSYYDDWKSPPELEERKPVNQQFIINDGRLTKEDALRKIKKYYSKLDERTTLRGRAREMFLLARHHGLSPAIRRIFKAFTRNAPLFK